VYESSTPEKVAMIKNGAYKAAIDEIKCAIAVPIKVRQVKYLNNIGEQEHREIKRVPQPMLGFKSFQAAANVITGIELMHMIRKGPFATDGTATIFFVDHFYALA
jgi:putative transposase